MDQDSEGIPHNARRVGRSRFFVPRSRRLTCDVLRMHKQVPLCPHHRQIKLASLELLRKSLPERISWPVLFLKAYGLLSQDFPVLRQMWMSFPWPTVYQHDCSIGMLAIQREYRGEPWLFWGRFDSPETTPLIEMQKQLDTYQNGPVKQSFKQFVRLSAIPDPLRRLVWWVNLQLHGPTRAHRIGTFFLSTLAGRGAEITMPPSFQTGVLSYGPIDSHGHSRVTLAYDHRLMDGAIVADCLSRIEGILLGPITDELRTLSAAKRALAS